MGNVMHRIARNLAVIAIVAAPAIAQAALNCTGERNDMKVASGWRDGCCRSGYSSLSRRNDEKDGRISGEDRSISSIFMIDPSRSSLWRGGNRKHGA
jgi:hypothetical protein